MNFPGKLSGTDPIVGWLNQLLAAASASRVTSIVGGTVQASPKGGTQIVISKQGPGKILYFRICKQDGTQYFAPVVVTGDPVLEEDIPTGAEVYDPTA
jgi:hypothetical protein